MTETTVYNGAYNHNCNCPGPLLDLEGGLFISAAEAGTGAGAGAGAWAGAGAEAARFVSSGISTPCILMGDL